MRKIFFFMLKRTLKRLHYINTSSVFIFLSDTMSDWNSLKSIKHLYLSVIVRWPTIICSPVLNETEWPVASAQACFYHGKGFLDFWLKTFFYLWGGRSLIGCIWTFDIVITALSISSFSRFYLKQHTRSYLFKNASSDPCYGFDKNYGHILADCSRKKPR